MKTSTKILLFTGLILFSTTIAYGLILRNKLRTGKYTYLNMPSSQKVADMEKLNFSNFKHLQIKGSNNLQVKVSPTEYDQVSATAHDSLTVFQQQDTLFIESKYEPNPEQNQVLVLVGSSALQSVAISGTTVIERNHTLYSPTRLTVEGHNRDDTLQVKVQQGGSVHFINNTIAGLDLSLTSFSSTQFNHVNKVNSLLLNLEEGASIDLTHAEVTHISGNIHKSAGLKLGNGKFQIIRE